MSRRPVPIFILFSTILFIVIQLLSCSHLSMNNQEDYYQILGVSKEDSKTIIKKRFRRLNWSCTVPYIDKHVPEDKREQYVEKCNKLYEAFTILSNDEKRKRYDEGLPIEEENENPFEFVFGFKD